MDPLILAVVFIGSNLWGMYGQVPFININPTNTFLERFLGSFQLTSVIYALQEIHPLVFPEATLDPPHSDTNNSFPLPPKKLDIVRTVTQYVEEATTRFATPAHRTVNVTETSLQPIWQGPMGSQRYEVYDWVYAFVGAVILLSMVMFIVWNSARKSAPATENRPVIVQSSENQPDQLSEGVVVDKVLFERLIETLTDEFQKRSASPGQKGNDTATNVVGILDLLKVKFPAGAGNDKEPRAYNAIMRLSERITKVEKGFELMFPPVEVEGASGFVNDSGVSSQNPSQPAFAQYKENYGKSLKEIDEAMKNYTKITDEVNALKDCVVMRESFNEHVQSLRNEMAKLYEAMAPSTEADTKGQLPDTEKATARHYTDESVKRTNKAWQARCDDLDGELHKLGVHLKEIEQNHGPKLDQFDPAVNATISALQKDMENMKQTQNTFDVNAGREIGKLGQVTKRLSEALESQPTGLEPLTTLGPQFATNNPFLQILVGKLTTVVKWIHRISETLNGYGARLAELGDQIQFVRTTNVFLQVQNEKLWDTIKVVAPEHVHGVEGCGNNGRSSEGHQSGPQEDAENATGVESQSATHQKGKDAKGPDISRPPKPSMPTGPTSKDQANAGARAFTAEELNIYDADTERGSKKDAPSEATHPSAADGLGPQPSKTAPASSAIGNETEDPNRLTSLGMEGIEGPANDETSAAWEREVCAYFRTDGKSEYTEMEPEDTPSTFEKVHSAVAAAPDEPKCRGRTEKPGHGQGPVHGAANDKGQSQSSTDFIQLEEQRKREHAGPASVPNDGSVKSEGVEPSHGTSGAGPASVSQQPTLAPATSAGNEGVAKQQTQTGKSQDQSQASTAAPEKPKVPSKLPPMHVPFDPKAYGHPKPLKNVPSFPPAATKTDYQPSTPKNQRQYGRNPKVAQGKGKELVRRPINQPPPAQRSTTTEEQQKLESWGEFSKEIRAKEQAVNQKIREEMQKDTGPKSAPWEENMTWKQSKRFSADTSAEPASDGRRLPAPPGIQAFASTAKRGSLGNLSQQFQSAQQPPAAGPAGSFPQSPGPSNQGGRGRGSGGQERRGKIQSVNRPI